MSLSCLLGFVSPLTESFQQLHFMWHLVTQKPVQLLFDLVCLTCSVIHAKSIFQLMTSASIISSIQHPKHLKCWPQKRWSFLVSIFSFDRNTYTGLCVIWVLKFTKLLQCLTDILSIRTHQHFSLFELLVRSERQMTIWTQLCNSFLLWVSCSKTPWGRKIGGNTSLP